MNIDLNADVAEGFAFDKGLMQIVSSANICTGIHAGSATDIIKTLEFAKLHHVRIGIHPSYDDRQNFGRTSQNLAQDKLRALLFYQMGAVKSLCQAMGLSVSYVKPHGALYNQASTDTKLAKTIAQAVYDFDSKLALMGLSGSKLIQAGQDIGLSTICEAFADRRYNPDGTLVARTQPNALIEHDDDAIAQVLRMVEHRQVMAVDGSVITLDVDSICLHGDGKHALQFAKKIKQALLEKSIKISYDKT